MRAAAAVACTAAALGVLAGCGSGSSSTGSSHGGFTTWAQAADGLLPRLDPHSANPCQRGDVSCLDLLIAEMRRREAAEASTCDHRALFSEMYVRTTEALRAAVRAGRFHDGPAIVHFGAWFARLDFEADDGWRSGHVDGVPAAWRVAYATAVGRRVRSMGDLLLGMNAHISRDLAFSVAALEQGRGTAEDPDFKLFTSVIESRSESVIAALARRFDPALAFAAVPLSLGGEKTVGQLIGVWRDEAWRNGIRLRDARGAERATVARLVEQIARPRADAIVASTAYVPVLQSSRSRDAYCRAHGSS